MDLRRFFTGKTYVGVDQRHGPGVDCVMDAAQLGIQNRSVGTVIMVPTIEHVWGELDAIENIFQALSGNGALIVASHMDKTIHAYPNDYWRFSPEAFSRLLDPFATKLVGHQGRHNYPVNVFGIGFKRSLPALKNRAQRFRVVLEQSMRASADALPIPTKVKRL